VKQLRIYFKNKDCEQIKWCYLADQAEPQHGNSLESPFKQLAQAANDIIFVVPQFWVYETHIDIADKNAKQLLAAAAYQLEDQLAEDVDDLHFAQGQEQNGFVPFVAIKDELMQSIIAFEKRHHLVSNVIITEMSLCAQPEEGEVNVFEHEQHILLKSTDATQNTVCQKSQLDFFLQHYASQNSAVKINRCDELGADLLCSAIELAQSINLKQKDYSTGHIWQAVAKSFALPMILLLILGVLTLLNIWQSNQEMAQQVNAIQQQQVQLLNGSLKAYSSTIAPKTALIKALQKQQGSQQQNGFIPWFNQFLTAKHTLNNNQKNTLKLVKVDYKNNKLLIDVIAKNLQQLDQLIVALKERFKVTVAQMDSSNNQSQGRFVLEQRQ